MEKGFQINSYEFEKRLRWSLSQKIDHSLYIIDSFMAQYPNCVVAFSGGVDSTVLLHLSRIIDKNRKGIFVNTTNEHTEILKFVRTIENIETILSEITFIQSVEKYGFPLISKRISRMINTLKHPTKNNEATRNLYLTGIRKDGKKTLIWSLPNKYKHIVSAPFDVADKCCYHLKKKPFNKAYKEGAIIGTMAKDSLLRKFTYFQYGCINTKNKQTTPLSIWTKQDIWRFIKQNKIEYCDVYDKGETYTGCAYCGFGCQFDTAKFARLAEREPKRYNIMMNLKNNEVTFAEAIKYALNIPIKGYQPRFFLNLH